MSFALKVYAVEIKSIAAMYGSSKFDFPKILLAKYSSEIEEIDNWSDAEISVEMALNDIFRGHSSSDSGEIYAKGIELICKEVGEELCTDEWGDLSMNWIMDINMEPSLPISELPIPKDYPYVLSIFSKSASEFIENFRSLNYETAAMNEAERWFYKIEKEKRDLVVFFG